MRRGANPGGGGPAPNPCGWGGRGASPGVGTPLSPFGFAPSPDLRGAQPGGGRGAAPTPPGMLRSAHRSPLSPRGWQPGHPTALPREGDLHNKPQSGAGAADGDGGGGSAPRDGRRGQWGGEGGVGREQGSPTERRDGSDGAPEGGGGVLGSGGAECWGPGVLGSVGCGYLGAVEVAAVRAREPPRPAVALIDAHIPQLDVHPHGAPTRSNGVRPGGGTRERGRGGTAVAEPGAGTQSRERGGNYAVPEPIWGGPSPREGLTPTGAHHCVHTHMHTRVHAQKDACVPRHPHACMHKGARTISHAHTHLRANARTPSRARTHSCTRVLLSTHTLARSCKHKRTHTGTPPPTHLNSGLRSGFSP